MPTKKTSNVVTKQTPDPMQYGFWKRLPYTLTDE